jgi:hypothetical protein
MSLFYVYLRAITGNILGALQGLLLVEVAFAAAQNCYAKYSLLRNILLV